ncbi:MAG: S8 family serine peptidase [Candidatus Thermoplasmatota archaeon]|nr:S8 family serine peptidase [Candidatus Thermoplasmatota archaeon]
MRGGDKTRLMAMISVSFMLMSIFPAGAFSFPAMNELGGKIKVSPELVRILSTDRDSVSLIVQFRDGPAEQDRELLEDLGFSIRRTFRVVPAISMDGPPGLIEKLVEEERVTYVENNDPVVLDMEMGTHVINATQVWASILDGPGGMKDPIDGKGVTVCVVDTGIDAGHPDLDHGSKTIRNLLDAGNGVWIEAENTDTNYGHGTHVAGTVAGNGHASAGARRGVAPGANLIGLTVSLPEEGSTPTEDGYLQGLEWVYEHSRPGANPDNIRVVTNSWHSTVSEYDPNTVLTQVIEKITFENNVVSTWSAGNDGRDDPEGNELTTSGQGNTPIAVMVAAYERDGSAVTDFSSRGRVGANHTYPDIGAPGRSIWSTSARRTVISMGSYTGGNTNPYYLAISGTSMSTPHVAGLVALLWQAAPSMKVSDIHEDYSGDDPEGWYSDPKTRIHEAEWILEASARFLPPDADHGNVAGDTNSTGWGGRPVDYVQGYGIVDAKRAVGIALTLERLRDMCEYPSTITVWDAIRAYDLQGVAGTMSVPSSTAFVSWSGEYSRYNDQDMNPLSFVNQTKFIEVPKGAQSATVTMTYAGLDLTEFKAGDLSFTIDTNGDGIEDVQSSLSFMDEGMDIEVVPVTGDDVWTFGIVGRGVKLPRPLQGINYVEFRMEYEITVVFEMSGNGTREVRPLNAVFAPVFPGDAADGGAGIVVMAYHLRELHLPGEEEIGRPDGGGFPMAVIIVLLLLAAVSAVLYMYLRRRRRNVRGLR